MLSNLLAAHLRRTAALYPNIGAGRALSAPETRQGAEAELFSEISTARGQLRASAPELDRQRPVAVATGEPKGAWAHVYYVSFHDPINSTCPTEGFYPVFLLSVDQKICWLSVLLAAGSVGITARGGWSAERGRRLRARADFLGAELQPRDNWRIGPIELGAGSTWLHREAGQLRGAGRAYECGAIVSRSFNPQNPPADLKTWLDEAFAYFDTVYEREATYLAASLPRDVPASPCEQAAAAVTGRRAEELFLKWVVVNRPAWGPPRDVTDRVGLGFDVEFPKCEIRVEVKGCRQAVEDIRLTDCEWGVARTLRDKYVLCIVSQLEDPRGPQFAFVTDPYSSLLRSAVCQTRLQVSYVIPRAALVRELNASESMDRPEPRP